jgi:hypothetical protein
VVAAAAELQIPECLARILVRREKVGHFCSAEKIGDCYAFENEEKHFNNGPQV